MTQTPPWRELPGARASALARKRRRPFIHGLVLGLIGFGVFSSIFISNALPFNSDEQLPERTEVPPPPAETAAQSEAVLDPGAVPQTVQLSEQQRATLYYAALTTATPSTPEASVEAVQPTPTPIALFELYQVAEGDTASAIAARFGIALEYLLANNPDLRDGEFLVVGQFLVIPHGDGVLYTVRYGENLSGVAERFGVTVDAIVAWPANGITSPDQVSEGQLILVPNGAPPAAPTPEPTPEPTEEPPVLVTAPTAPPPTEAPPPPPTAPPAPAPAPASSSGLIWPVSGPISSYMGPSHPLGIDIDLYANPNAAIAAATSGTVTFAGGHPCCSYGLYVVIVSPDGIETLYAHLSSIAVSAGQQVAQGEVIGYAGCTGYCTGNHLHFEVIDNGVRVDPLSYLP